MADWKANLSFSDRLTETAKMQVSILSKAYKSVNPDCPSTEATKHAKSTEENARKSALTLNEYHELCAKEIEFLSKSLPTGDLEDRHAHEHVAPNLPTHGAQIGRYINAQHYNDGLFSEIFKAIDPDAKDTTNSPIPTKLVALKITTPETMHPPHDSRREARILTAAASKSAHIIPLLDTFEQAGGHFVLVFPFLPLGLNDLLSARPEQPLPLSTRKPLLRDLFAGLAHLHNNGIIHRDIKPSNLLLASPGGPVYLADFGIAWSATDPGYEPADSKILDVGTTCYRPPELLFGHQGYNTTLDLWAAGCVAAQVVALGGRTLFDAGDLGSELALIKSVFETLGTPSSDEEEGEDVCWPEAKGFPDWGKMEFTRYPGKGWREILPGAEPEALDLVRRLVVFESGRRLRAEEALKHPYLN
ncbi:kinase-like protein [Hortaea werneckii]|nr:kinase-like protein [Hortaea werneckii]